MNGQSKDSYDGTGFENGTRDYAGRANRDVVEQVKIAAFVPRQLQFDWGWWRGLAKYKAFRTTLRFPSGETSEKIPFACAYSVRGIVSAHRCLSAVGFSSPTYYSAHGATSARRFFSACVLWWPCVGRPRGAPGSECTGLLTCVRLPPFV